MAKIVKSAQMIAKMRSEEVNHSLINFSSFSFSFNHEQMFRTIAILASIVGASAFAPVARVAARSSALKMNYEVFLLLL